MSGILTTQEIDAEIKRLQELKKLSQPQSSYDSRPLLNKLAYDFQPIKFFTSTVKILIVLAVIAGLVFGYGYYKGRKKTIDQTPVQMQLGYGKEQIIQLNKEGTEFLHITKTGDMHIQDKFDDKTAKILYTITTKDIPALWARLKPFGFDIKPFLAVGGSVGQAGAQGEVGVGMQWYRFYKAYLNSFITTAGLYPIGISYRLADNFDIMLGAGFGYKGDTRVGLFGKLRFW